jgi:hypothetical protein
MLRGEVESRPEASDLLEAPGDVVLVHRGRPRSLVIACPDGCGAVLTVNLDERAGAAWRLYREPRGLTLYPSVWRDSGCKAHFIVRRDRVLWCGPSAEANFEHDPGLEQALLACLDERGRSAEELACLVDETPWDTARAADRLVTSGHARASDSNPRLYSRPTAASAHRGVRAIIERIVRSFFARR